MRKLISENMKYPKEAAVNKIEGYVNIRYGIDYKGNVSETKIMQGLGYGCDEEAARLVKLFKFVVPKNPRKVKVGFHKTMRIHFKLTDAKKTAAKPKSYQYTMTTKKVEPTAPSPQKSSYTYTIKY